MTSPVIHKAVMTAISTLTPHPRNYLTHEDDQLVHIEASIREHGFYRNVVVSEEGVILAGHGVVEASKRLGLEKVPAVRVPLKADDPRALKLLAGDNEISNLATVNDRILTELLREVAQAEEAGLLGTGFDQERLANLVFVTRPASEIADFDAARAWVGLPAYDEENQAAIDEKAISLVVTFKTPEERETFCKDIGLKVNYKAYGKWSTTWPYEERKDLRSVRFVDGPAEAAAP